MMISHHIDINSLGPGMVAEFTGVGYATSTV
jgi:hypothetical protein